MMNVFFVMSSSFFAAPFHSFHKHIKKRARVGIANYEKLPANYEKLPANYEKLPAYFLVCG